MSESHAQESPTSRPEEPAGGPPAQPVSDPVEEWTVDEDGVVDAPSDDAQPSADDDLDPTDAP